MKSQLHRSETPWHFPLALPTNPIKRIAAIKIGQILAMLMPTIANDFVNGVRPSSTKLRDRLILAYLVENRLRAGRLDELSHLHHQYWQSHLALSAHAELQKSAEFRIQLHHELVSKLEEVARIGQHRTLCEIGCGNGWALNYLAGRFETVERFIGLDLSQEQIEIDRSRYRNPKLNFICADALAWIETEGRPGWIFWCHGGVFEYLPQKQLERLLSFVAKSLRPAVFAIAEPLAPDHQLHSEKDSRPFGRELSFSHNHEALFRQAGFLIHYSNDWNNQEGWRLMRLIALTPSE